MKAVGIVRRIDDLGRIVIPKELRKTLNMSEGDPLEMFVEEDSNGKASIILQKYEPENEMSLIAERMKSKIESEYCGLDSDTKKLINQNLDEIISLTRRN